MDVLLNFDFVARDGKRSLRGVPLRDELVLELARLVDDDELGSRLETAYGRMTKVLALTIAERETIIQALDDPPPGSRSSVPCCYVNTSAECATAPACRARAVVVWSALDRRRSGSLILVRAVPVRVVIGVRAVVLLVRRLIGVRLDRVLFGRAGFRHGGSSSLAASERNEPYAKPLDSASQAVSA